MSCSTCHEPRTGGTVAISGINLHDVVMPGADPHTFGNRKPPSNTYASFSNAFRIGGNGAASGGNFWDGRAIGFNPGGEVFPGSTQVIDDSIFLDDEHDYSQYLLPIADQALNPFPNHVEQNISRLEVCQHVEESKYAELFTEVFGEPIDCSLTPYMGETPYFEVNYQRLAVALAAWQSSPDVNSFSSKLDEAMEDVRDDFQGEPGPEFPLPLLTDQENLGHDLFYANCATICHNSGGRANITEWDETYTSQRFFNIGTPANPDIPGYDPTYPDLGLMAHTYRDEHKGQHRTPTLRNIDKRPGNGFTKAYAHNGWFKSMESIVHFYNTRDMKPRCPDEITSERDALVYDCWPAPEVSENVFTETPAASIGNLGLTPEEEAAIVAYLRALTDKHTAKEPKP